MSDDPGAGASASPGERLRGAREGRGWTAAHAADLMRVPVGVVEALEAGRYADLGAAVFARGHLRRYATLLDLPADALIDGYDRSHSGPAAPSLIPAASAHTPVRATGDRLHLPAATWYVVVAAVAAALAGGWWWWNQRQAPAPEAAAPAAEPPGERPSFPEATGEPAPIPEAAPLTDPATEAP